MRLVLLAVISIGCATGYQASGITGGYSEARLSERAFRVTFEGNGYTTQDRAQRGAIRRAAELAFQNGYFGFWVGGQNNNVDTHLFSQPMTCNGSQCTGGTVTAVEKPTAVLTVNLVTEDEARQAPPYVVVYEASTVLSQGF